MEKIKLEKFVYIIDCDRIKEKITITFDEELTEDEEKRLESDVKLAEQCYLYPEDYCIEDEELEELNSSSFRHYVDMKLSNDDDNYANLVSVESEDY